MSSNSWNQKHRFRMMKLWMGFLLFSVSCIHKTRCLRGWSIHCLLGMWNLWDNSYKQRHPIISKRCIAYSSYCYTINIRMENERFWAVFPWIRICFRTTVISSKDKIVFFLCVYQPIFVIMVFSCHLSYFFIIWSN